MFTICCAAPSFSTTHPSGVSLFDLFTYITQEWSNMNEMVGRIKRLASSNQIHKVHIIAQSSSIRFRRLLGGIVSFGERELPVKIVSIVYGNFLYSKVFN